MNNFKSVWIKPAPKKPICEKLAVCQSKIAPSCPVGVCRLKVKNAA
jgi:hypothetical protein